MSYDRNNLFARVLRGEVVCDKVYEDAHVLAFRDTRPQAPTHVQILPKREYLCLDDFCTGASETELVALFRALGHVARAAGVVECGYRVLANSGRLAHVPHFHAHLVAGRDHGGMLPRHGSGDADRTGVLERLWRKVLEDWSADPEPSDTARLIARGPVEVARELGKAVHAAASAAGAGDAARLAGGSVDLLYLLLVLWAAAGLDPIRVAAELAAPARTGE